MSINIRQRGAPSATLKFGLVAEVGINIRQFVVRYYPEVNEIVPGVVGRTQARVISSGMSREITCEGEINGTNAGLLGLTLGAAVMFANTATMYQATSGTVYLDEATATYQRGGWATVSIKASARTSL